MVRYSALLAARYRPQERSGPPGERRVHAGQWRDAIDRTSPRSRKFQKKPHPITRSNTLPRQFVWYYLRHQDGLTYSNGRLMIAAPRGHESALHPESAAAA